MKRKLIHFCQLLFLHFPRRNVKRQLSPWRQGTYSQARKRERWRTSNFLWFCMGMLPSLFIFLSINLSIHLSIVLYFDRKNSIFLSLFLYLFLSLSLSLYLSLSIYLSIDLSHTLTHFLFFYPMLLSPCVLFCLTLFRSSFLWEAWPGDWTF